MHVRLENVVQVSVKVYLHLTNACGDVTIPSYGRTSAISGASSTRMPFATLSTWAHLEVEAAPYSAVTAHLSDLGPRGETEYTQLQRWVECVHLKMFQDLIDKHLRRAQAGKYGSTGGDGGIDRVSTDALRRGLRAVREICVWW